jgi:outer membrane immunogenic protein
MLRAASRPAADDPVLPGWLKTSRHSEIIMKPFSTGIVILALLPLALSAHAANLPVPTKAPLAPAAPLVASPDWSGFYAGFNGGIANEKGVLVGGQIGYNFQTGPAVFGIEADYDSTWANVAAPDLGTVRGRIGYAFNQIMPYVTGGWAFGDHDSSGYAIGGGLEYRILPALSVKAEYLHVELDHPDDIVRAGINFHFNSLGLFSPIGSPIATRY